MAIFHSCCLCCNLRTGSCIAGIYSIVSTVVLNKTPVGLTVRTVVSKKKVNNVWLIVQFCVTRQRGAYSKYSFVKQEIYGANIYATCYFVCLFVLGGQKSSFVRPLEPLFWFQSSKLNLSNNLKPEIAYVKNSISV